LPALSPLFAGVFIGAVLALVNQLLLHSVGRRLARARQLGRQWFDRDVFAVQPVAQQASPEQRTLDALETLAAGFENLGDRLGRGADDLVQTATVVFEAAERFAATFTRLEETHQALQQATAAAAAAANALQQMASTLVGPVQTSALAFQTAIEQHLVPALARQQDLADELGDTQGRLETVVARVDDGAALLGEAGAALRDSVQQTLVPAQQSFGQVVSSFEQSVISFGQVITTSVQPATQHLTNLNQTLTQLRGTANDLRKLLDMQASLEPLLRGLESAGQAAQGFAQMPAQMQAIQQTIDQATAQGVQQLSQVSQDVLRDVSVQVGALSAALARLPVEVQASLDAIRQEQKEMAHEQIEMQVERLQEVFELIVKS
jgi:hypothetical protein